MTVTVKPVRTKQDFRAFLNLPRAIYSSNSAWIEPLRMELKQRLNSKKNSFYRKGEAALFLARRGDAIVGRVSAQIDRAANPGDAPSEGHFGFYEAINDVEVGTALFDAVGAWHRERKTQRIIGPCNFRLEDPAPGFLVRGQAHRPTFMMAYSPPYYVAQAEAAGYSQVMGLHAYNVTKAAGMPRAFVERSKEAAKVPGLRIREISMQRLDEEVEIIRNVFNASLKDNWGFVPISTSMARGMARDLKRLADPRVILIAEVDGQPVGAVINLPNYNDILHDCRGQIFPKGLYRILCCKKDIRGLRGYAIGVLPEYRKHGLACLFIYESWIRGLEAGYTYGEITWILGSNKGMNDIAGFLGGHEQKAYCLVEKLFA